MEPDEIIGACSAIAQPTRLRLLRHLARTGPLTGLELSTAFQVPKNTVSVHLAILTRAGLVRAGRSGRNVRFQAVQARVRDVSDALMDLFGPDEGAARHDGSRPVPEADIDVATTELSQAG